MNAMMDEAEQKIQAAVHDINQGGKPPENAVEVQPFVILSQKLADSIVEVYQQQLNQIANKLDEAKATAQQIREMTNKRADDISEFKRQVEAFGTKLIDAHKVFIEGVAPK